MEINKKLYIQRFLVWAYKQPNILALALVGSYARSQETDTSDMDWVLVTKNPEEYLHTPSWIHQFDQANEFRKEDYGMVQSIRVFYEEKGEVEYSITDEHWAALPLDPGTKEVLEEGITILFDKTNVFSHVPSYCMQQREDIPKLADLIKWVDCWSKAGPELEKIKAEELKNLDYQTSRPIIDSMIDLGLAHAEPRTTSGMVEMQYWFKKYYEKYMLGKK